MTNVIRAKQIGTVPKGAVIFKYKERLFMVSPSAVLKEITHNGIIDVAPNPEINYICTTWERVEAGAV